MITITLHRLEVFASVAKYLCVTRAARELRVSQPAVSQEIGMLEEFLGFDLIEPSRRGVKLTVSGVSFRTKVDLILAQIGGLKTKCAPLPSQEPDEVLALGASHGLSTSVMPPLMARFENSHPKANLHLRTETSREIVNLLVNAKLEIAVVMNPRRIAALRMEPFRSAKLCALVPANHRLAKSKQIGLSELARMPLVIRNSKQGGRTELLLRQMRKIGLKPNVAFGYGSPDAVKSAVRNGAGVGILVHDSIQDDAGRNDFAILKIAGVNLTAKSYILYAKKKPLSAIAQEFLALLRETGKKKNTCDVVTAQLSPMLHKDRLNGPVQPSLAARQRRAVVTPTPMV